MGAIATGVVEGTLSAATYAATEKLAYGRDHTWEDTLKVGLQSGIIAGETKEIMQALGLCNCFIAGTLVATETGYYYLQTRYYNPEWGRFLNADGYINANGDILGYNMFAYCGNNPVMGYDPEGTFNLDKFFNGGMRLAIGALTVAGAISVASCGAATPLVIAVAAVAFAAGAATAVNGASDIVESVTDYNPVRDTIFAGDEEQYLQYEMQMALGSQLGASAMYGLTDGGNNVCFKAGTLVSAENGDVAIENIKVGDFVWATDPETGEIALKEVLNTFVRKSSELIHITVNGEKITTTPTHPFWVPQKGWVDAIQLRAGDRLQLLNGEYVIIEQIQHEILEAPINVYNFEVAEFHTYYVTGSAILVHNSNCGDDRNDIAGLGRPLNKSEIRQLGGENTTRIIKQQYGGSRSDLRIIGNDVYVVGKHNKYGEYVGKFDELVDIYGGR